MKYTLLNVKTDYYLLSSLIKIDNLINFCNANNVTHCGICDNNLSSSIEFYNKCKQYNIKPIIGLEIKYKDHKLYLYAENFDGYKNLLKINSQIVSNALDQTNLIKYSNNVIVIMPYESINLYKELNFFEHKFLGYKNEEEKTNSLIITDKVIYNTEIKMFNKEDIEYLEYLNYLGGSNKLNEKHYIETIESEKQHEINQLLNLINLEFKYEKKYIPVFDENKNSFEYLKKLSNVGLKRRLNNKVEERYQKRLDEELKVINDMGFTDYFLIVYDYVLYAKKNNILVGPGRGSAAGSLVCYCIGIIDVDPVEYDLLFERFLNKDRVTMPDIDIDFDSEKRDIIIDYVRKKYGKENVATGLTYNTLKSKLVLREIGKILKIDNILLDKFIKNIDRFKSLKNNLDNETIRKYLDSYEELKKVYKISMKLENLKKNISTHAAGIVICDRNLDDIIPIYNTNDNIQSGFTMDYLEELGLLKMDFLGLKNLTIISNIMNKTNNDILKNINLNDKKVIEVFKSAKTDGIFQYETYAMKKLLEKLKPNNFEEIIAAVALVRPGPSDYLDEYITGRDNPSNIKYLDKRLETILKETYGVILYQEQIIKIFVLVANFSLSEADIIRRAISKKKYNMIEKTREKFINGAIKNGYDKNISMMIFDRLVKFADFGFNKSHSVAYALIGYQMAYLKVYYEQYFTSQLLNDLKGGTFSESYLIELKSKGINIIKPDINFSENDYYIKNNNLVMPLKSIKGITSEIENIVLNNKPYTDLFDFFVKCKSLNSKIIETLVYSGALRSLKINSKTILINIDVIKNYADLEGFTDKPILKFEKDYEEDFLRKKELEYYGFYVGNHPSSKYQDKNIVKIKNKDNFIFKNIKLIVTIDNVKRIKTKKGDDMAFVTISDETGKYDAVAFKESINYLNDIKFHDLVLIDAKVSKSYDKISVIINNVKRK